uniref:Uncharacterized protein n=1 Tax=Oryza brachyantha TaxID=4533 RepID=J3NDF7_ORYBR
MMWCLKTGVNIMQLGYKLAYKFLSFLKQWRLLVPERLEEVVDKFRCVLHAKLIGLCRFCPLTVTLLQQDGDTKKIVACSIEKDLIKNCFYFLFLLILIGGLV